MLVDRKHARLLTGTVDGLVEAWRHEDDVARPQSTPASRTRTAARERRYERGVEKEVDNHLRGVADELRRRLREVRVAGILVGGRRDIVSHFEDAASPPTSASA